MKKSGFRRAAVLLTVCALLLGLFSATAAADTATDKIVISADTVLDLNAQPHLEKDGKVFIGWKDASGKAVAAKASLKKGDVLTAVYASRADEDFRISAVTLRTAGETGLRFIVCKKHAFAASLPEIVEYGTLVLPTKVLNDNQKERYADLEYGREYTCSSKKYTPAAVKAETIYASDKTTEQYTLCITNLEAGRYRRQYTVRGYIRYKDLNGVLQTVYTEERGTNPYETCRVDLKASGIAKSRTSALKKIIKEVEDEADTTYRQAKKTAVLGSASDPNRYIFKLDGSNFQMREITVNTGKGGDPLEIIHLTDTHMEAGNNSTLEVKKFRTLVDYVATADQVILSGDTFSSLTDINLKLMQREVWEALPNALAAIGNHETYGGTMENNVGKRYQALQEVWKHNVFYTSRVLGDKVMVIQLDDGTKSFRANQVEPLRKDLETARKKGYAVLIFTHIALITNNPKESAVDSLTGKTKGMNFQSNRFNDFVGQPVMDSGATKNVYELITNNADIVKGVFCGHAHDYFYTEIVAKTGSGQSAVIPQYVGARACDNYGHMTRIIVK